MRLHKLGSLGLALVVLASGTAAMADMLVLVSSYLYNNVKEYDFETGLYLKTLVPSSSGNLSHPGEIAIGPGQDVYVSSANNRICRYDANSGALLGMIGVGNVSTPRGLAFGSDNLLYVSSAGTKTIQRYDPDTGHFLGTFANVSGAPIGLAFGPDGNLYAAVATPVNRVERFDGNTGASLGFFTPTTNANNPQSLAFGPNGDLYVHSQYNYRIIQYDGATGAYKRIFINQSYPFNPSAGMAFGPDGNLYTTNLTAGGTGVNDGIDRYDGSTGQFMNHFINAQPYGSYWSAGIAIYSPVPEPSTLVLLSIGTIGLLARAWRRLAT